MDERDDWLARLRPLRLGWPIRYARTFGPGDIARLRDGVWPVSLEDRWVIWLDGTLLRAWRGGTGECLYESELALDEAGGGHAQVLRVCDDADIYARHAEDAVEADRFDGLLALCLGRRRQSAA